MYNRMKFLSPGHRNQCLAFKRHFHLCLHVVISFGLRGFLLNSLRLSNNNSGTNLTMLWKEERNKGWNRILTSLNKLVETAFRGGVSYIIYRRIFAFFFLTDGSTPPSGPGFPHYQVFTTALRHTTRRRIPLDGWSAQRRDLFLTTHDTHKRGIFMKPGGIQPRNPSKRVSSDPSLRPRGHRDLLLFL
jgi:hypothetical protein